MASAVCLLSLGGSGEGDRACPALLSEFPAQVHWPCSMDVMTVASALPSILIHVLQKAAFKMRLHYSGNESKLPST